MILLHHNISIERNFTPMFVGLYNLVLVIGIPLFIANHVLYIYDQFSGRTQTWTTDDEATGATEDDEEA